MRTIWKYKIPLTDKFELHLPVGAEILYVNTQIIDCEEQYCMWVGVNSEASQEKREFILRGTGHGMPDVTLEYIGSFWVDKGVLIFHLFEVIEGEGLSPEKDMKIN